MAALPPKCRRVHQPTRRVPFQPGGQAGKLMPLIKPGHRRQAGRPGKIELAIQPKMLLTDQRPRWFFRASHVLLFRLTMRPKPGQRTGQHLPTLSRDARPHPMPHKQSDGTELLRVRSLACAARYSSVRYSMQATVAWLCRLCRILFLTGPYTQPQTRQESPAQLAVIIGSLNARIAAIPQQLQQCEKHFQRKFEDLDTRFRLMTYNLGRLESLIRSLKNQQACRNPERRPYK